MTRAYNKERRHEYYLLHKGKALADHKIWRAANIGRDRVVDAERRRRNRKENPERVRSADRGRYDTNIILMRERARIKYAKNPEPHKANSMVRRARKLNATVESFLVSEIYERDAWRCQLCNRKVDKECKYPDPLSPSLDHIIPLSLGGDHSRQNVHLAHLVCNMKAHTGGIKQLRLF